jgi:hypothetical protein
MLPGDGGVMASRLHMHQAVGPGRTLVQLSTRERLALVALPLGMLWLAVAWALA